MTKLTIQDFDNIMREIMERPMGRVIDDNLLEKLRVAATQINRRGGMGYKPPFPLWQEEELTEEEKEEARWEYHRYTVWRTAQREFLEEDWAKIGEGVRKDMEESELTVRQVGVIDDYIHKVIIHRIAERELPQAREEWAREWGVTEKRFAKEYPIRYLRETPYKARAFYQPTERYIGFAPGQIPSPDIIAHEMAHVKYFEDLSPLVREEVAKILDWVWLEGPPKYREAILEYPENGRGRPYERHAKIYEELGKHPSEIPIWLRKYYGGLMPYKEPALGHLRWAHRERLVDIYTRPWDVKPTTELFDQRMQEIIGVPARRRQLQEWSERLMRIIKEKGQKLW